MEQKQLQKIKITAINIKSVLISKNKKIVKLDRTKSILVRKIKKKEERKLLESNIEKSNLNPVKKAFSTVGGSAKSFMSKVLDFFGYLLMGALVKKLPQIMETVGKFINFIKPVWNVFMKIFGAVGKVLMGIIGVFNPKKNEKGLKLAEKDLLDIDKEYNDKENTDDVVDNSNITDTARISPKNDAPIDNDSLKFESPKSSSSVEGGIVQALNEGGTLQNPMNFDGKGVTAIRFKRDGSGSDFKLTHGGAEIYRRWTENKPLKQGNVSSSMFGLDQSISRLNRSTDSNSFEMKSTPIARAIKPSTQLITNKKKKSRTVVMTFEREVQVSGDSNLIAMNSEVPSPLLGLSGSSMRLP